MSLRYQLILFLLFGILAILFTIWLKKKGKLSTVYTRKIFHILIFTAAGLIVLYLETMTIFLYGFIISCLILITLYVLRNSRFFEALTRESDRSKGNLHIILPLVCTAVGGAVSVLFFGKLAMIGFLVTGWGDGLADPIGTCWGKHKFRAASWDNEKRYKSMEGSSAVLIFAFIAATVSTVLLGYSVMEIFPTLLLISIVAVLVEAFSFPGTDNLTIQIAASGIGFLMI
ncbi:diacylglycerol/polyprenol kinase family protein [Candidatus Cloacimonadota bacterium]